MTLDAVPKAKRPIARFEIDSARRADLRNWYASHCHLGFGGLSPANDGTIFFARSSGGLLRTSNSAPYAPEPFTRAEPGTHHVHPHLVADARALLFTIISNDDPATGQIAEQALTTGQHSSAFPTTAR
jgi:hypothetical protein